MPRKTTKQTTIKAIHLWYNKWKLGDYDSFSRDGEIVVGQLCHIDMESGLGTFRGFVLADQLTIKVNRQGQYREWTHLLSISEPAKVHPTWVARYESHLWTLPDNEYKN